MLKNQKLRWGGFHFIFCKKFEINIIHGVIATRWEDKAFPFHNPVRQLGSDLSVSGGGPMWVAVRGEQHSIWCHHRHIVIICLWVSLSIALHHLLFQCKTTSKITQTTTHLFSSLSNYSVCLIIYIAELILPFKCHSLLYIFTQDTAFADKKSITAP